MARIKRLKAFSPAAIPSVNTQDRKRGRGERFSKECWGDRTCDMRRGDNRASLQTHCVLRVESVAHSSLAFWKFLELFYEHVQSTDDVF